MKNFYDHAAEQGFTPDEADQYDEEWETLCRNILGLDLYKRTRRLYCFGRIKNTDGQE